MQKLEKKKLKEKKKGLAYLVAIVSVLINWLMSSWTLHVSNRERRKKCYHGDGYSNVHDVLDLRNCYARSDEILALQT